MQNINKILFQVIFIFSDWIFIKQIIVFSTSFALGETDFQKILSGVLIGERVKMHRLNSFSGNMNIINWNIFPIHGGIYKLEKIQKAFRDNSLRSLKKYERMYPSG